jgi:hypothetical protein
MECWRIFTDRRHRIVQLTWVDRTGKSVPRAFGPAGSVLSSWCGTFAPKNLAYRPVHRQTAWPETSGCRCPRGGTMSQVPRSMLAQDNAMPLLVGQMEKPHRLRLAACTQFNGGGCTRRPAIMALGRDKDILTESKPSDMMLDVLGHRWPIPRSGSNDSEDLGPDSGLIR